MDSLSISTNNSDLKFNFVLSSGGSVEHSSIHFKTAFQIIKEGQNNVMLLANEECCKINPRILTKQDILIFDEFQGKAFDNLRNAKALVLGPKCLIYCFSYNCDIPPIKSPIFTLSLNGFEITTTACSRDEKAKLKQYISYMGGRYSDHLQKSTKILLTNTVRSQKYQCAAELNVLILTTKFIYDLWDKRTEDNYENKYNYENYKLPIFHNLNFTSTALPERDTIKKLIEENGGRYCPNYSHKIDILILNEGTISEKFKAACSSKKDCLTPNWLYNSVKSGYALPCNGYVVERKNQFGRSTPNKVSDPETTDTCFGNYSLAASEIEISSVNETRISQHSEFRSVQADIPEYKMKLEKLDVQKVKSVGNFLDGCIVYLCGFTAYEMDKLSKILNNGGAIRFETMNDKVTHVLIGSPHPSEIKQIGSKNPMLNIITFDWLVKSISLKQPANEVSFLYQPITDPKTLSSGTELPSPASKKDIDFMNNSFKKPLPRQLFPQPSTSNDRSNINSISNINDNINNKNNHNNNNESNGNNTNIADHINDNLVDQYLKKNAQRNNNVQNPKNIETQMNSIDLTETCTDSNLFVNLTFKILGFSYESLEKVIESCKNCGGKIVYDDCETSDLDEADDCDEVDYLVVPTDVMEITEKTLRNVKSVVNEFWFEDSLEANKILEMEYYYKPILFDTNIKPLEGLTIVISMYSGVERNFIKVLSTILGANVEESYNKKSKAILISMKPEGSKYNAAIKWRFPVVSVDWLLACYERKERVPFTSYVVGASIDDEYFNVTKDGKNSLSNSNSNCNNNLTKQSLIIQNNQSLPIPKKDTLVNDPLDYETPIKHRRVSMLAGIGRSAISCKGTPVMSQPFSPMSPYQDKSPTESLIGQNIHRSPAPMKDLLVNDPVDYKTPIKHRRVSVLAGIAGSVISGKGAPFISQPYSPLSPYQDKSPADVVNMLPMLDTPTRETLKDVLTQINNDETPNSRRQRHANINAGIIPPWPTKEQLDSFSTPNIEKLRMEKLCQTQIPSPSPLKEITPTNSTLKKIMTETLKDEYVSSPDEQKDYRFLHTKHMEPVPLFNKQNTIKISRNSNADAVYEVIDAVNTEEMNNIGVEWSDHISNETDTRTNISNKITHTGIPRFCVTRHDNDRESIKNDIEILNGEFDGATDSEKINCTHLLSSSLRLNCKVLGAIASGKWLLHKNYIDDSKKAGHFLNEELYEMGNPKSLRFNSMDSSSKQLAICGYKWRLKILSDPQYKKGIFTNMKFILDTKQFIRFKNVVELGGGVILNVSPPYHKSIEALTATHFLYDAERKDTLSEDDRTAFTNENIYCNSIEFIRDYITNI